MLLRGFTDNVIKAYHRYMVTVAIYFGANKTKAENDFAKVLLFEMMLANVSFTTEDKKLSPLFSNDSFNANIPIR